MEHPSVPRNVSRDRKCGGAAERTASRTRQGTKLRDMLMSDKPNLSYADFHHEITRNQDDVSPKHVRSKQSQELERTTPKEDELVRYMSNLPSYLEQGKNFQEKALNVGVLDWKLLEKWRYSQKQMPQKQNGYSPSSSNTSLFTTDGSSTHSSRGQSCSPARQRMHRPAMKSPVEASPREKHVQDSKSSHGRGQSYSPDCQRPHNLPSYPEKVYAGGRDVFSGNASKFQDSTVSTSNYLSRQQKVFGALPLCERKESDLKSAPGMGQRLIFDKYEMEAPWKGKTKIQGNECTKQTLTSRETKSIAADRDCLEREKSGVPVMPRDQSENSSSGVATSSNFIVKGQLSVKPDRKIISRRIIREDTLHPKVDTSKHSDPAGSRPQYLEGLKCSSHVKLPSSKDFHSPSKVSAHGIRGPSQASHMLSFPARMFSSPSRSRITEEKKPVAGIRSTSAPKSSEEMDLRKSSEFTQKTRNPSPIRRLSFAMGKMIKNAGSRDNSPLRRSGSKDCLVKSGSEVPIAASSTDNGCSDKLSTNNNRGRSSPLRRLFDPLLKSRASNISDPSKKRLSSVDGTKDSCSGHSVKGKSRSASGSVSGVGNSHHDLKNGSSSLQALLQVSFKNGFPLFTFAIDNESDILAATVRKSYVPSKGHHNWTYTFFTVHEVKRKSGIWLNQGGKGDGHGYVPNVVAQMKVTDLQGSPLTKHENSDDHITREFDLFAVDVSNGDQYSTDFHPTNELAAVVAKLPKNTGLNPNKDDQSNYYWLDSSQACSRENLQESESDDDLRIHHSLNLSTTVILPGGIHTVPSKGEISTLAQRWRSGGACDCGGWDLGCQLRVCTNQRQYERKTDSSATCSAEEKFQLFSQVGQDNQMMLSLVPFKERIYSVEFNSSLSLLQAFAVCISFVDCRRPAEFSETSNVAGKTANEVGVFEVPVRMKASNHQTDVPTRYVSYPPHSPVGRV